MKIEVQPHTFLYNGRKTPAYACAFADRTFINDDEETVLGSSDPQKMVNYVKRVAVTGAAGVWQIAAFDGANELDSNTNTVTSQTLSTYTLSIFDAKGVFLAFIGRNIRLPDTPLSTEWDDAITYSQAGSQPYRADYYDTNAINRLLASLETDIDGKQDTLVNTVNIKSVNGQSLLGSGNITLQDFTRLSSYADLAAAVTAIGAAPTTLLIDGDSAVSTAVIIPSTLELLFINGKKFTKSGAGTITFQGRGITGDPTRRLFSGFANTEVKWTGIYPERMRPEWFGAAGDNATDDADAFDAVLGAMQGAAYQGATIMLSSTTYYLSRVWHIQRNVLVTTPGTRDWNASTSKLRFGLNTPGVVFHGASTYDGVAGTYTATMGELRGFTIISNDSANNTIVSTNGLTITITGGSVTEIARLGLNVAGDVSAVAPGSTITINGYEYVITDALSSTPTASIPIEAPRVYLESDGSTTWIDVGLLPNNNDWAGATLTAETVVTDGGGADIGRERFTRTITSHTTGEFTFVEGSLPAGAFTATVSGIKSQTGQNARINMYPGLDMRTQAKLRSIYVERFSGNGIQFHSGKYPSSALGSEPNCNNSYVERLAAEANMGSGFVFVGINSNNIETHQLNFRNNRGYGIFETGSLGSNHYGFHAAFNYKGAFKMVGDSARNMIFNSYTEGGEAPGIIGQRTLVIGGNHAAGLDRRLGGGSFLSPDFRGMTFENGFAVRRLRGYYANSFNPYGWIFYIGRQEDENTILSFGAAEDDVNAGDGIYRPTIPSYYLSYGSDGRYALGYSANGNQSGANNNPLLQISGSEAAEGPGLLRLPKGFIISDGGVRPAASEVLRGYVWVEHGGAGVRDTLSMVIKNAADAYAWADIAFTDSSVPVNAQTGTTYTLQASDNGKVVTCDNAAGVVVTVPSGLGVGFHCQVIQLDGEVSFTTSSSTLNNRQSHTKIAGQFGVVTVESYAADAFILAGDTTA